MAKFKIPKIFIKPKSKNIKMRLYTAVKGYHKTA